MRGNRFEMPYNATKPLAKDAPRQFFLFPGFVDCFSAATEMGNEVFGSVLTRGHGQGRYKNTMLRKIMSQHLKVKAPSHGIFPATVDTMYDHPGGQVAKNVYDRHGSCQLQQIHRALGVPPHHAAHH